MRTTETPGSLGPRDIVFCSATQMEASLRDKAEAASEAGFVGLSVSILDYRNARSGGMSDADIHRLLSDQGLLTADIEALFHWSADSKQAAEVEAVALFDIAEALGSTSVVAGLNIRGGAVAGGRRHAGR